MSKMDIQDTTLEGILREGFMTMKYADMVITCSDGAVPIHRHILAAASAYLHPLLRDYNSIESHQLIIPDVSVITMKHVLSLLYTGHTISSKEVEFTEVVEAVKLLGIDFGCNPYKNGVEDEDSNKHWEVSQVLVVYRNDESTEQEQQEALLSKTYLYDQDNEKEVDEKDIIIRDKGQGQEEEDEIEHEELVPVPKVPILKSQSLQQISITPSSSLSSFSHQSQHNMKIGVPQSLSHGHLNIRIQKRALGKEKLKIKRPMYATQSETANVIQAMLESGQLCLTPSLGLANPLRQSLRGPGTSNRVAHIKIPQPARRVSNSRTAFQNIPQNIIKYGKPSTTQPASINRKIETIVYPIDETSISTPEPPSVYIINENFYEAESPTSSEMNVDMESETVIQEENNEMTAEEILDAAKISSQKDHAYANFADKKKGTRTKIKQLPTTVGPSVGNGCAVDDDAYVYKTFT